MPLATTCNVAIVAIPFVGLRHVSIAVICMSESRFGRMKVEPVFAQVRAPRNSDQGVTVEGCFVVDGNRVTMTDREGKPIVDDDGKRWLREITANCTNASSLRTIDAFVTVRLKWAGDGGYNRTGPIG